MRLLPVLAIVLASVSLARAEAPTVEFGGEPYTLSFEDQAVLADGRPGDGIAEFTLAGETVEDWSKLFAYHAYPEMGDDPVAAVRVLGKIVKETNKDANFAIIENETTGEAIIDFLTWAPESDVMEFNVFKSRAPPMARGSLPCSTPSTSSSVISTSQACGPCGSAPSTTWPQPTCRRRRTILPTNRENRPPMHRRVGCPTLHALVETIEKR